MKMVFEGEHWALSDEKTLAASYLERKLEFLEKNEFKAEKLSDVVNNREDDAKRRHQLPRGRCNGAGARLGQTRQP